MAENPSSSPVFADRYRFETVSDDWDKGRSGFTHLVYDLKKKRLGVIKRADTTSKQAIDGLRNEAKALKSLKGLGVPEVYNIGQAVYGSKIYEYMVIEYIDGFRIERDITSLSVSERVEILTQFFYLLARAHRKGIVNGDVDLKHLFWRRDKNQLIVIDWGNAQIDIDPKKKSEFAYDLARSAEIIYSLTTLQGHPSATGSIALPNDSLLIPGLAPVPVEFHNLCKWAPRTPTEGTKSPHTAPELFDVSKKWGDAVHSKNSSKTLHSTGKWISRLIWTAALLTLITLFAYFRFSFVGKIFQTASATSTLAATEFTPLMPSNTPGFTETPSATTTSTKTSTLLAELTSTPSVTPTLAISAIPKSYTPVLIFQGQLPRATPNPIDAVDNDCWTNETNFPEKKLGFNEGFYSRRDDKYKNWGFKVENERATDQFVQTDFSGCLIGRQVDAIAINVWIPRLELQRDLPDNPGILESGKEFGFFIKNANEQRREYTAWVDKNGSMHLRIREDSKITLDDVVLIVNKENLKIKGSFPRFYSEFPIQIFFEINNNGLDIIYLRQGPVQKAVKAEEMDPTQMIIIHNAVRPTLGTIQNAGLIGYGGETQTVIWPLVFFGK